MAADLSVVRSTFVSQILVTQLERSSPYTGLVTSTALLGFEGWFIHRTADWWYLRHYLQMVVVDLRCFGCYVVHGSRILCAISWSFCFLLQVFLLLQFHTRCWWKKILEAFAVSV